jgi:hypothetical protein
MARPNTSKNDKEVNAVIFNMKEQRCLLKNLHTLDAEASYSLKLIDLNNRGIKLFYRRFKDKVNKIKSHLQTDEIAQLKILDASGKMKELVKPLNITGALRIADAEKRLKLQGRDNQRMSRSALYRRDSDGFSVSPRQLRPNTCIGNPGRDSVRPKRPRSLSSGRHNSIVALSSPTSKDESNSQSVKNSTKPEIVAIGPPGVETKSLSTGRHNSIVSLSFPTSKDESNSQTVKNSTKPEIVATGPPDVETKTDKSENECTQLNSSENQPQNTNQATTRTVVEKHHDALTSNFHNTAVPRVIVTPIDLSNPTVDQGDTTQQNDESHKDEQNDKTVNKKVTIVENFETFRKSAIDRRSRSRGSSITRMSAAAAVKAGLFSCHTHSQDQLKESAKSVSSQGDSLGNYVIDDPYEERRRTLLDIEYSYANNLNDRKDEFLDDLDAYITMQQAAEIAQINTAAEDPSQTPPPGESTLEKLTRREMRFFREHASRLSQADIRLRGQDLWKDITKCRYLRMDDDKMDLSGLVSLAKNQMKLGNT